MNPNRQSKKHDKNDIDQQSWIYFLSLLSFDNTGSDAIIRRHILRQDNKGEEK